MSVLHPSYLATPTKAQLLSVIIAEEGAILRTELSARGQNCRTEDRFVRQRTELSDEGQICPTRTDFFFRLDRSVLPGQTD